MSLTYYREEIEALRQYATTRNQHDVVSAFIEAADTFGRINGSEVAESMGKHRSSVNHAIRRLREVRHAAEDAPSAELPPLPSSERLVDDILDAQRKNFQRIKRAKDAARWRTIRLRGKGPMGLAWFGDPHLDSPGCDIDALERDIDIVQRTPGMFAANAGDSIDNWVGRLVKFKGKSHITDKEAWRLAEWFLDALGDRWVVWVMGNHDEWNEGVHVFERLGDRLVPMDDWNARIVLRFDNGRECRVHMAHDFKGHSQYNPVHGMKKADLWSVGDAQVYLGGHKHETMMSRYPCPYRGKPIIYGRAMGYKAIDGYGDKLGFSRQAEGETIALIFDQDAKDESGFVTEFTNLEVAADFLTFLRKRAA